jgi:5-methylcytosine-specific restriction endonuclease McrA
MGASVLNDFRPIESSRRKPSTLSKNVLIKSIVDQKEKCAYCDRPFGSAVLVNGSVVTLKPESDHFVPRAKRLNNSSSNIVAACHLCNKLKSSREFDSVEQTRAVISTAWGERGWMDAPLLLPFKRAEAFNYN